MKFFILILTLSLFLFGCGKTETLDTKDDSVDLSGSREIIILHTNDIHAYFEEQGDSMGAENLKAVVEYFKSNYDNVLVFDAGDMNNTNSAMDSDETINMIAAANSIGYNAWTLGNNDDIELTNKTNFPMVSSNLNIEGYPNSNNTLIIEEGGLKIGLFGITAYSNFTDEIGNKEDMAKSAVDDLKAQGADFIIGLTHLGVTDAEESSYILARKVEGIDLIIDGHSHTLLETGTKIGDTLVVQAEEHLKYLGVVKIYVKNNEVIYIEASVLSKADVENLTKGG